MRNSRRGWMAVVGGLTVSVSLGLLAGSDAAWAAKGGNKPGGGGGGKDDGGSTKAVAVCLDLTDGVGNAIESDGVVLDNGHQYCNDRKTKVTAKIQSDGRLSFQTWDSTTRAIWLDLQDQFSPEGGDCAWSFSDLSNANLVTLGSPGNDKDAELTDAQLNIGNGSTNPDLLDLRTMTPGLVLAVAVRLTFEHPDTGEHWRLAFADRADDTSDNLASLATIIGGADGDGDGFSDSWTIGAGQDDLAVLWHSPAVGDRIPCAFVSAPFEVVVSKQ